MAERVCITSGALTAEIDPIGAELQSLSDAEGREMMSAGDPAFWSGRAPLLFPVVGRLNGDAYRLDGARYAMPKHGFARRQAFDVIVRTPATTTLRLRDSDETRRQYPFAFELDAHFAVTGPTLAMTITVRNTGDAPMPASFGYHPAFAWPLPGAGDRARHRVRFHADEPAPIRVLSPDGLVSAVPIATPVDGRDLALTDDLFTNDALIWDDMRSRSLHYGTETAALEIAFPDTDRLGIWTKPGAAFLCIEPWAGIADPEGYQGEFRAKPGIFTIDPGGARPFRMSVTVTA